MIDLSSVAVALISGMIGGGTALAGQYASQRASRRAHLEDLQLRSTEMLSSFAVPITARRAEALQELFTILQRVLDTEELSLKTYDLIRDQLIFVPPPTSSQLLAGLSEFVHSHRADDSLGEEGSKEKLRLVQQELRKAIGLETIDRYVQRLNELRSDTEAIVS